LGPKEDKDNRECMNVCAKERVPGIVCHERKATGRGRGRGRSETWKDREGAKQSQSIFSILRIVLIIIIIILVILIILIIIIIILV